MILDFAERREISVINTVCWWLSIVRCQTTCRGLRNSIANALELRLSCTNPLMSGWQNMTLGSCICIYAALKKLTHTDLDKMAIILQTTFSNPLSWMEILLFWLKVYWSFFLKVQLTMRQNWFKLWLGAAWSPAITWSDTDQHLCVHMVLLTRPW